MTTTQTQPTDPRPMRDYSCPVAPLAPGETVKLPDDADHYARMLLAMDESGRLVVGITNYLDDDFDVPFAECYASLDLAGVRQLEATCRRARAAMEGDA